MTWKQWNGARGLPNEQYRQVDQRMFVENYRFALRTRRKHQSEIRPRDPIAYDDMFRGHYPVRLNKHKCSSDLTLSFLLQIDDHREGVTVDRERQTLGHQRRVPRGYGFGH